MPLFAIHTRRKAGVPDDVYAATRSAHLHWQFDNEDAGRLLGAGPLTDPASGPPPKGGLIILRCTDAAEAKALADSEPYHAAGLREYDLYHWSLNESGVLGVGLRAFLNGDDPSNPKYRRPE